MNAERLLKHYKRIADAPDAITRLRRFILDLAVRGNLVPQDPNDETAAELLKRIAKEKARLVKIGEIRKEKPLPSVDNEMVSADLPSGWSWVRLGHLSKVVTSGSRDWAEYYAEDGAIFVRMGNLSRGSYELRLNKIQRVKPPRDTEGARTRLEAGDILVSITGEVGLLGLIPPEFGEAYINQHICVVRLMSELQNRYIPELFRSPFAQDQFNAPQRGIKNSFRLTDVTEFIVPLPPLAEQLRIVAKVDELMALCDRLEAARGEREATRDRLAAASLARLNVPDPDTFHDDARFALDTLPALTMRPDQIKQLRQTILNLAVRGKLVPQDPNDEPASELLKRIAKEKARLVKEGKTKRQEPLPEPDLDQTPFDPPVGWAWGRFPELGTFGRGKSKHRPRNDPALFDNGTHLMIQTGDVARSQGVIESFTNKYNDFGLSQSLKWPKGTLCITIAANIADSGILSFDACFPDSVVGFVPASEFENARYFEYFVRTAKANLLEFAPATAQKNINLEILTSVLIPLPPLAEQHRIVAKVDELMTLCDRLEASLAAGASTRRRLLDALLAEALAPTESELEAAE